MDPKYYKRRGSRKNAKRCGAVEHRYNAWITYCGLKDTDYC